MDATGFKSGDHLAICDSCGFKFLASVLKKRWDNFMVCPQDYETRNPQDLIKGKSERINPPWTRPEPTDSFITNTYEAASSTVPAGTFNVTSPIT